MKEHGLKKEKKHSIFIDANGDYRVISDRLIFDNKMTDDDRITVLKTFVNDNLRGRDFVSLSDGANIGVAQKNKTVGKLIRPGIQMPESKYRNRQDIVSMYDETIEGSYFDRFDNKKSPAVVRKTIFEIPIFDNNDNFVRNESYDVELLVKKEAGTGKDIAYDVKK